MASNITVSEEDVAKIRAQFNTLDQNNDGMVTVQEMRKALKDAGQDYTMKDIQQMMKKADKNGDGRVVWDEFLELMANHIQKDVTDGEKIKKVEGKEATVDEYSEAMQAFKMFDQNSDGMIDIAELKDAMQTLDLEQDPEKVQNLMAELDKNGDGHIDYVEFGRLLGI